MLLTDGTVMVQDANNNDWYKLTPDNKGNYITGTWSQLASTTWGPLYYASQVLVDGRVFVMGGEYNFGDSVWTNQGAIYDPVKNTWTPLAAPSGWDQIGDMGSVTLPNGKVLVQDPFSNQGALFDPATNTFTSPYGIGKGEANDEEGLTLLPNGNVYTVDVITANGAEIFNTSTGAWSKLPNTPYDVVDRTDEEIGAAIVQPNGTVMQFGGNGKNIIYNPSLNTWSPPPVFPASAPVSSLAQTPLPVCSPTVRY